MRPAALLACLLLAPALGACGRGAGGGGADQPHLGARGGDRQAAQGLGFPDVATKNTTRVGGADAVAIAAASARAVFPGPPGGDRPPAVVLVDRHDWHAALAATVLMAPPVRAPLLLTDGASLPPASAGALAGLSPTGSDAVGGQVVRLGAVARPKGLRSVAQRLPHDPFGAADAIDRLATAARGSPTPDVVVVAADAPSLAMPAAAWAAKSGDPVLFVDRNDVPAPTRTALRRHQHPHIYVLGGPATVGTRALRTLRRLGTVTRVGATDPVANAIAFARFSDGAFGWGIRDPGHGLVVAAAGSPLDAAAAAALSSSGTYGPLLVVDDASRLAPALRGYLLDIRPAYKDDPVRGFYNHAWLVGDEQAVSAAVQRQIDALLEVVPVAAAQSTP